MSTRFYPRFVKGNPQLRIFLPDWKIVMIRPKKELPKNVVSFKVDPKMTEWDIKNYLEKIYKVPVAGINSYIWAGKLKQVKNGLAKEYDFRVVNVTLPIGQKFEWPDLFPEEKFQEEVKDFKAQIKEIEKGRKKDPSVPDAPSWFM